MTVPADCLHVATVRAPLACASLDRVDATGALALPGVVRVLTAADVRGTNRFGLGEPDQPVLAERCVRGASDVVALVIGRTERLAREGARRVRLSMTPNAELFDPARALDADAPIVHPERTPTASHPNVVAERTVCRGNAARSLERSALVIEGEYRTAWVEHAFLAPEAGFAERDGDGRLTLHVATQWPAADLRQAAAALGEPVERLRIVQATIGGAFGGREDISLQILLLLAARETGLPVRMVWDRAESIRGHGKRHPFRIRHQLGADRRGRLMAARIELLIDAGCYASTSGQLLDNALAHACGPYAIRHVEASGRAVYTNNPYTCAFRGFGANQVAFAMEQQLNKLADALRLNPGEIRRRNFVRAPGVLGGGSKVPVSGGLPKTLALALQRTRRSRVPNASGSLVYGRGIASAIKNIGFGFGFDDRASAAVLLTREGATVRVGAAEVGQGSETVLTQIAATTLGLPPERIRLVWRDSMEAPDAGSSSASRQTLVSGNAVLRACERVRRKAEEMGGVPALPNEGVSARHTYRVPETRPIGAGTARHLFAFGWSTCVVDVAVDQVTGQVTVLRVVSAIDAGRVINPRLFEGQVEGGVVMGQGYALQERCLMRDGMPTTLGFESCGVPTAVDAVAKIESIAIEEREPAGPFGARGIGEITMIPVVPAITSAIHAACGVWIDELPASPERIRAALDAQGRAPSAQRGGGQPSSRRTPRMR
jgi:CO/xanthine dehydrogenase Mo-binding subunit